MVASLRILVLEPYWGGSHRAFLEGWKARSRHRFTVLAMPARHWKWRMRGAAVTLSRQAAAQSREGGTWDVLLCSDMLNLAEFAGLVPAALAGLPRVVYFHENQITYPDRAARERDVHFGLTNITTALAADRVLFNSLTHRSAFLEEIPRFLRRFPDRRPHWVREAVEAKSGVQHPGCHFDAEGVWPADAGPGGRGDAAERGGHGGDPPLIIWNHRWEFDKQPEVFFRALDRALDAGLEFRLALLGENFQVVPKPFLRARERYGPRVMRYGHEPSRARYTRWLLRGDLVVSTAIQENFGIATVEAIRLGCFPLLPNRLSYPELLPREHQAECLYDGEEELFRKLRRFLLDARASLKRRHALSRAMARFAWERRIGAFDAELERLCGRPGA